MVAHMEQLLMQLHVARIPPNRIAFAPRVSFHNAGSDTALLLRDAMSAHRL